MFQNYMDDLSQFCLVLGQFVTLLFWTICHKSYLSSRDDMSKKERSGYGADRSQLSFS